jgi:hypothetical protein
MSDQGRSERLQRLEQEVNQRARKVFSGLREQLAERLRRMSDDAVAELTDLVPETPPAFFDAEEVAPLTEEAGRLAGRRALVDLLAACAAIDRARTQGDILDALAREGARFASRTAVLLTRATGAEVWSAHGWEGDLDAVTVAYPEAGAWSTSSIGRAAAALAAADCADLCGAADEPLPEEGLLVPLVLRDRLAALVYADRRDDGAFEPQAIQALTWAAALALESLPFRERSTTATLYGPGDEVGVAEPLPLWGAEDAEGAGGEAAHHRSPAATVGFAAAGLAAAGLAAAAGVAAVHRAGRGEEEEEAGDQAPTAGEETGGEVAEEVAEELAEGVAAEAGAEAFDGGPAEPPSEAELDLSFDAPLEEAPGPEVAAPPVPDEEVAEAAAGWTVDELPEPMPDDEQDLAMPWSTATTPAADREPEVAEGAAWEEDEETAEVEGEGEDAAAAEGWAAGPEEVGVESADEAPFEIAEGEAFPETEGFPGAGRYPESELFDQADEGMASTVAVEEVVAAAGEAEQASGPAAVAPGEPARGAGAEVVPPPDVAGPGSAFMARGGAKAGGEDRARHDEAKRLARLLVSEIRLYNEDEVEAGRRNGDIYERLKEDIDRSRQMYEERVDPLVRESTDYFYEELVRNLGAGDARALGL